MATTIIKQPEDITFTDSPQWITAEDVGGVDPSTNYFIELRVWTGLKTSIPTTVTTSLFLPAVFVKLTETNVSFEISKFIQAYIENDIHVDTSSVNYNGDNAVWYNFEISADSGSAVVTSDTKLALQGRGTTAEGSNPGTTVLEENNKLFGNYSDSLIVDVNGSYSAPVYVGDTSQNKGILLGIDNYVLFSTLGITLNSLDSAYQVAYIPINETTVGGEWVEGNKIDVTIGTGTSVLTGISFVDGAYMDMGLFPLLFNEDDYLEFDFKAFNWDSNNAPFGYQNGAPDRFSMVRTGTNIEYRTQNTTNQTEAEYTEVDDYHTLQFLKVGTTIEVSVNGIFQETITAITPEVESTVGFYLGGVNNAGVKVFDTDVVFSEVRHYDSNTATLDSYNNTNNWGGATNYGGTYVVSYNDGDTWAEIPEFHYDILIECSKGSPMVLKYLNLSGVLNELPINGSILETFNAKKTNYQNSVLDSDYNYNPLAHVTKTFDSNATVKMDVFTGWVNEGTNQMVRELLVSKFVWLETSEQTYPVQINTKSVQVINRTWRRETGYNFSLDVATKYLNDIL